MHQIDSSDIRYDHPLALDEYNELIQNQQLNLVASNFTAIHETGANRE